MIRAVGHLPRRALRPIAKPRPPTAGIDAEGALVAQWPDGHASRFDPGWRRAHAHDDPARGIFGAAISTGTNGDRGEWLSRMLVPQH
ncbi:hypothetical protein [Burkholderia sp. MSMB1498]|uniref:hypothetical protein n=1 Tax=Burkholderia sp. MSMB1498 TaxID=1637842 RepID=UPI00075A15AF|nr:hypothetical protein [Burkholderia sp. MSMB1498]KVK84347.1 hypothetical protein WS91_05180 [Burkholderia sp. MSMB1498]